MNLIELRQAQARYVKKMKDITRDREDLQIYRKAFIRRFRIERILSMELHDYVLGVDRPNGHYNFCYGIERELDGLGSFVGATAYKFGIYYGRTKSDETIRYRWRNRYGENADEAFYNVKVAIRELIKSGENEDMLAIAKNSISPMFKGKILSTYFPDRYLNVFAPEHLDFFLIQLDLDTPDHLKDDPVYKRETLRQFKNDDLVMSEWSLDLFSHFLYTEYPGRPPRPKEKKVPNPLKDYVDPIFPTDAIADFIELDIQTLTSPKKQREKNDTTNGRKIDFENQARRWRKLGDRGEKLVLELEKRRLNNAMKTKLAKKIDRVSLRSDSLGYDILSFEENGDKRYIEVKATASKVGEANFFFTANELFNAEKYRNYYIYMVYDVLSVSPKVWAIKNPFNPMNKNVSLIPSTYKVKIIGK